MLLALAAASAGAFVAGAVWAVAFSAGVAWWTTGMFVRFFGIPTALAAVAMYLLCVGIPVGLFAVGAARMLEAPRLVAYAGIPALWVAGELLRTSLFTGLPWEFLGHVLYRRTAVIQLADTTGAYGVSFL